MSDTTDAADLLAQVLDEVEPFMHGWAPEAFSRAYFELAEDDPRREIARVRAALARWAEDAGLGAPVPRVLRQAAAAVSSGESWREVPGDMAHARQARARREARHGAVAS